ALSSILQVLARFLATAPRPLELPRPRPYSIRLCDSELRQLQPQPSPRQPKLGSSPREIMAITRKRVLDNLSFEGGSGVFEFDRARFGHLVRFGGDLVPIEVRPGSPLRRRRRRSAVGSRTRGPPRLKHLRRKILTGHRRPFCSICYNSLDLVS